MADTAPLLAAEAGIRQRAQDRKAPRTDPESRQSLPEGWDPDLPYGGRVYLARKKKPDSWWMTAFEVALILFAFGLVYYSYYHFDNLHYHIARGYAHMGYATAQHQLGQKLLQGHGVGKDEHQAMEWFKKAADQGHPESSYNLAVGHLKKIRTDLVQPGQVHDLIKHAVRNGITKANRVLEVCNQGGCDD